MAIFGQCDCCDRNAFLRREYVNGVEVFACAECCGEPPGQFDEDEEDDAI